MKTTIQNQIKGPSLSQRMVAYEEAYNQCFTKRTPIIIRLDGRSFSQWTRNLDRPFDSRLPKIMQEVMKTAMQKIQGCVFAFSQSDELSFFIRDYDTVNTESWFGSNIQKLVSSSASLITAYFNETASKYNLPLAFFDSRAFILPKEEVVNYFIYRQHDGIRNSVSMHAQNVLGHKAIQGKTINEMKQMLLEVNNPWEDLKTMFRHGIAIRKDETEVSLELPLFKDDRSYIEELVYIKPTE